MYLLCTQQQVDAAWQEVRDVLVGHEAMCHGESDKCLAQICVLLCGYFSPQHNGLMSEVLLMKEMRLGFSLSLLACDCGSDP